MMLRQCLAIAAATPNLIPIPAAHAPSTDQPVKLQCFRSSYLSKTDARTPQIPIDCSGETEPLPARDFVPWRFSDACRRSAWVVMQASEKPAQEAGNFTTLACRDLIDRGFYLFVGCVSKGRSHHRRTAILKAEFQPWESCS